MTRRAVIDIGTNSVKLLVGDVSEKNVTPVFETSEQTRLGRGFYSTHKLQPDAISQTVEAIAFFMAKAREFGAESVRLVATSAARDAKNALELTQAIHEVGGQNVEIISGEQEADWVFQGVTTSPALGSDPLLILDVGGGSTEFIFGVGAHQRFRKSFNLGTVRLLEQIPHSDPPLPQELQECRVWLREFLTKEIKPHLEPVFVSHSGGPVRLVGTGGTATIMARIEQQLGDFDRERIEATRLTQQSVKEQTNRLWSLALAERRQVIGLPSKRADVILTGVCIYEALMEVFGFPELWVSTRGLRYAALIDSL